VILVFGSGGQVGQELIRAAQTFAQDLKGLSHSACDIADRDQVCLALAGHSPSVVINAAAYTKVDAAESEPEAAKRGNATGPLVLAQCCHERGIPLIHISTDYVFDGSKIGPYIESDPIAPVNVYGRTKADGENNIRAILDQHVIIRTAWVYSAFGANFLKTMLRLAQTRTELRVVGDQVGCPTSARELAVALLRVADAIGGGRKVWGTYHFAGSGVTSWFGFAERIMKAQAAVTGRSPKTVAIATSEYPTPARRPANSAFDCSLFTCTFGFAPKAWELECDATVAEALAQFEVAGA
jgi:dTDP-4-dehydrorhamnose reductase